jgi:glycosyltransferase domain-containing protein
MLKDSLTLYIPTMNRSQFLNRSLKYYNNVKFDGTILIGDSSNKEEKKLNEEVINKYPDLDINYHHLKLPSDHHDALKTNRLLDKIKTPYITFAGDDDFQIPNGLKMCTEFLNYSPDYVAAHGHRLNFTIDNTVNGNVIALDSHPGYDWTNEDDPIKRWQEYLRCGVATTYYVHRTENWKKYYSYSHLAKSNYIGNELIPCSLCVLSGKIKRIECLSTAFQRDNPIREFSFVKTTLWDLINGEYWRDSVRFFEEAVTSILSDKFEVKQIKELFYQEFWYHCLLIMNGQFNGRYGEKKDEPTTRILDLSTMSEDDDFYPIHQVLIENSNAEILSNYLKKIQKLDIREGSTNDDFMTLINLAKSVEKNGIQAVEIGSWKGGTAGAIGQVVKENKGKLYCCDPWANETCDADHSDILEIFKKNISELELEYNVVIIREPSREAFKHFEDESLDIVFLDGLHMYPYIYPDVENFYPKVKKGGIIAGHDLNVRYETLNSEQWKEIDENINVNCVTVKSLGRQVHCGVARAVYDYFGSDYNSSDNPMNAVWWVVKE